MRSHRPKWRIICQGYRPSLGTSRCFCWLIAGHNTPHCWRVSLLASCGAAALPHDSCSLCASHWPHVPVTCGSPAGGQVIQRMVQRALQLGAGPGTAAFHFEVRSTSWPVPFHSPSHGGCCLITNSGSPHACRRAQEPINFLRQKLKDAVNAAPLSDAQRQRVMHEHCLVFQLNSNIVKGFTIEWRSILAQHRTAVLFVLLLVAVLSVYIVYRA